MPYSFQHLRSSGPQDLRRGSLASGIQTDTCDDAERHAAKPDMFNLRKHLQGGWDMAGHCAVAAAESIYYVAA